MKLNSEFFMEFTYNRLRHCSTCAEFQVGATLVKDFRIISHGYNGTPSGCIECREIDQILKEFNNLDDKLKKRCLISLESDSISEAISFAMKFNAKKLAEVLKKYNDKKTALVILESLRENKNIVHSAYEIHAEQNALIYALNHRQTAQGAELYVSMEPCIECAKLMIVAGIKRVYFKDRYKDKRFGIFSSEFLEKNGVKVRQLLI